MFHKPSTWAHHLRIQSNVSSQSVWTQNQPELISFSMQHSEQLQKCRVHSSTASLTYAA